LCKTGVCRESSVTVRNIHRKRSCMGSIHNNGAIFGCEVNGNARQSRNVGATAVKDARDAGFCEAESQARIRRQVNPAELANAYSGAALVCSGDYAIGKERAAGDRLLALDSDLSRD